MDDHEKKTTGGGMFLVNDVPFQEVFTPEDFNTEHHDIANAVEDFIKGEIISLGEEIEIVNNDLSRRLMKKAGELGFLGIEIPEKCGGMGLDKISSAIVSEKFGYGAGSFTITELNHTGIGTLPVALFGTEKQKKKYIPGLSSGELVGAFALTEPEAGSDALNPLTTATLTEDDAAHVTLNRPQALNVYNIQMRGNLYEVLSAIKDDSEASVGIFKGAGERPSVREGT